MESKILRDKFFDFFADKNHGSHKRVPSASLLPKDDPSVLLTTAGMQQFKPYFAGEPSPYGNRVVSIQKCFRTSDIDEVGDRTHLTFFEMMGNFGFEGQVSKEQAIYWAWDFLTGKKGVNISKARIAATYYGGGRRGAKEDLEAKKVLEKLNETHGIPFKPDSDNFWGPTGDQGPCGPTVEFYVDGTEIWNLVFNEFYFSSGQGLRPASGGLGIDTGMGLERLTAVSQGLDDIFQTDLFRELRENLEVFSGLKYQERPREFRVVLDHLRGAVFLLGDGIRPSNKEEGYVLRRLLRRIIVHLSLMRVTKDDFDKLFSVVIKKYKVFYPELAQNSREIFQFAGKEFDKFSCTLEKGLKEFNKRLTRKKEKEMSGEDAFYFFSTYGLPIDFLKEKIDVDEKGFEKAFAKHQQVSRAGVGSKFGGHGLSSGASLSSEERDMITRLHTATHLLHAGLKKFLGPEVTQAGSDITPERSRFDFTFPRKLTEEEKKKIEDWVNHQIQRNLVVSKQTMPYRKALELGAEAFFKTKYPSQVDVYTIGDPDSGEVISRELCAGPHVANTSQLGQFKIIKEESSSAGVRRIRFKII